MSGGVPSIQSSRKFAAVTPSDTVNFTGYDSAGVASKPVTSRGILVAVAGNVAMINSNGDAVTVYLSAGVIHPIVTTRVNATNTAATGIVMFW